MDDSGSVDSRDRLRALEATTRGYGAFGELGAGLGTTPAAICFLAAAWAASVDARLLAIALTSAAGPAILAGSLAARAWYQRRGRVVAGLEPTMLGRSGGADLARYLALPLAWLVAAGATVVLVLSFVGSRGDASPVAAGAVLAGALATALVGSRIRRFPGAWSTILLAAQLGPANALLALFRTGPLDDHAVVSLVLAAFWLGFGLITHAQYVRLGRRLDALRRTT
jgi:hypothetical protein